MLKENNFTMYLIIEYIRIIKIKKLDFRLDFEAYGYLFVPTKIATKWNYSINNKTLISHSHRLFFWNTRRDNNIYI